jgi:hypothetical protein
MSDYQSGEPIRIDGVMFDLSKDCGALVVYCNEHFRGRSVGSQEHCIWANVVERNVNGERRLVAVFPRMAPNTYLIWSNFRSAYVTVFAGHVAEIDWR